MFGWATVRAVWFPIFILVFLVPLPGGLVNSITLPLKELVSVCAEFLLGLAGYSVARQGVILQIGPYQLLMTDACSGLYSIISLVALVSLYLYVTRRGKNRNIWCNVILLASAVPIAILANVVRVVALALITLYFGDAAGQSYLHGLAGITVFVAALILLIVLDGALSVARS